VGYTILLELNRLLNGLRSRLGYGYWSLSAWLKHKVKRAVNYIGDYEEALARQCQRQGYQGVICGHIHHAEIRDVKGIRYMNCGDWVESRTALVEEPDGQFRVIDYSNALVDRRTVVHLEEERLSAREGCCW